MFFYIDFNVVRSLITKKYNIQFQNNSAIINGVIDFTRQNTVNI